MTSLPRRFERTSPITALFAGTKSLSPVVMAIAVTGVYVLFVLWRLRLMGNDPSYFVIAGPLATDPRNTLPNLHVFTNGDTYDGQFFYRLALEPWTRDQTAYGITLDLPAYRQQRILYPLIAWLISAGNWQLVPLALIIANILALAVLAYATAALASSLGRSALVSVAVPFYPGYAVTVARDLAELTEAALLVLGVLLVQRRRFAFATAALTAGVLAKETLLVMPISGIVVWILQRRRGVGGSSVGPPLAVWLVPLVAYGVWSTIMLLRWGATGMSLGAVNFDVPLTGILQYVQALGQGESTSGQGESTSRAHLLELGLLLLVAGAPFAVVDGLRRRSSMGGVLSLACVVYAVLALLYGVYIWRDAYAYLRALHELFLTGVLAVLGVSMWKPRLLGLGAVVLWVVFVLETWPAP